jgi:hypothetical protein
MSNELKQQIREQIGDSLTAELGPTLEIIGRLAKELWWEENGTYLTAEERDANKKTPMATSVDSHKRRTRSRAKGSTSFNISLSVSVNDDVPLRIPVKTTGFTAPLGVDDAPIAPSPAGHKAMEAEETGEAGDGFPVPVDADPSLSTNALLVKDQWRAEGVLREIIGTDPLTKGAIRKAVADRVPEPMWVAELDRMVRIGEVMSTGERRSTRYTMCEVSA